MRPAPAVRRAQAAGRDRARVRRRPADRGLRRADLGARRVGAGGDPQPAGRPAAQRATSAYLFISPRPGRGPLPVGPDRGAVPRPGDGGRPGRARVQRPAPPLHRGPAVRGADARGSGAIGSGSRARSPARPIRRAAAEDYDRVVERAGRRSGPGGWSPRRSAARSSARSARPCASRRRTSACWSRSRRARSARRARARSRR